MILMFLKNLQNQMTQPKKKKKSLTLRNAIIIPDGRQRSLNALESIIFPKRK